MPSKLVDMFMRCVFSIPVKDISNKTLVHEHMYKAFLMFGCTEKFLSDNRSTFINEEWKILAKGLDCKYFQSSLGHLYANGKVENIYKMHYQKDYGLQPKDAKA